jgi:hypothetical protein
MNIHPARILSPLFVVIALLLNGCHSTAPATPNSDILNRLPASVAQAFAKQHPHVSPSRVHVRLFPDGTTHYQIIYPDPNGQSRDATYLTDGRTAP